jgi:hypothetical protein
MQIGSYKDGDKAKRENLFVTKVEKIMDDANAATQGFQKGDGN